ncbi:MAG: hypothetical protein HN855_07655 [Anaerolineae bacterium]|jgi:hypothetical protein|nr:hypothetical protein [Anaerolineae bacterium]MBT7325015.1 hypothetical protein [Anaerolineae bacterium]
MTTTNIPAVVNEEEFEVAVETVSCEDGWLIGSDGIVDPDGNIALLVSDDDGDKGSEAGHGLVEWLALCSVVAAGVLTAFRIFAPAFITTFQTQVINALP